MGERGPYKAEVTGSIPVPPTKTYVVMEQQIVAVVESGMLKNAQVQGRRAVLTPQMGIFQRQLPGS